MKTIVNKLREPLTVELPRGKTLHLGPKQAARISVHDADHPPLKALVKAGSVEVVD